MEDIKVSIILPVYNTAKYLKKCIESLINQTLKEIEIICVDDGSTDNSVEILREYEKKDSRIKVLVQKHKKQGAARNYGMDIAKGEYIGFVDSDDWCELDMYEKLYKRAKETDSDMTMCSIVIYNDNDNTFDKNHFYFNLSVFEEEFFDKTFSAKDTYDFIFDISVCPVNRILKRSFINEQNIRFPENLYNEDNVFSLEVSLKASRISLIKDFGYYYRRQHSQTSNRCIDDIKSLRDRVKISQLRIECLKAAGMYKLLKKNFQMAERASLLGFYSFIVSKKLKILFSIFILLRCPILMLKILSFVIAKKYIFEKIRLYLYILISNFKKKKMVFWGDSLFLNEFLEEYRIKFKNIIGIIDKNIEKKGRTIKGYKCYEPSDLQVLKPDIILISIVNNTLEVSGEIKKYLKENNINNIKIITIYDKLKI